MSLILKMLSLILSFCLTSTCLAQARSGIDSWALNEGGLKADLIMYNASIITMEPSLGIQQAIAIKGDRILAVGPDKKVRRLGDADTVYADMRGGVLMPGLVDAHTHMFNDDFGRGASLRDTEDKVLKFGVTTLGNMYSTPGLIKNLLRVRANLRVRLSVYMPKTTNCGDVQPDWYLSFPPTREPGEMLRIGGVKIFTDGGSCFGPAFSQERIPGEGLGNLFFSDEEMKSMVKSAHDAGYQVAVHAIGDRGIEQALDAIDTVLRGGGNSPRHRIEHNGVLTSDIIERYGEVGAIPTVFGYKRTCWLPAQLPLFFQESENAHRSLLERVPELHLAWHGDDPWVEPLNPFIDMYSLVTRIDVISSEGPCNPPTWLKEQRLTINQVLKMMTVSSAYALDREKEVGSLKAGKFADMILLSDNPLTVPTEGLLGIEVKATMVGGEVFYINKKFKQSLSSRCSGHHLFTLESVGC